MEGVSSAVTFNEIVEYMPVLFKKLEDSDFFDRKDTSSLATKGVYVFYENLKPIYVGRSQSIPKRILAHSRPSSGHNSATFAFLLAKEVAKKLNHDTNLTRKNLQENAIFNQIYLEQKQRVSNMKIKSIEVNDPDTQAIFEIYASRKLKTKYNDFATH